MSTMTVTIQSFAEERKMSMSKNICPRCKGESIIIDNPADITGYLCAGCEIEIYTELHTVMDQQGLDKESAYQYLKTN